MITKKIYNFVVLQILAVNGISLLNLPYSESLKLLKNTGPTVEITISQIYQSPQESQSSTSFISIPSMTYHQQQQHHHHQNSQSYPNRENIVTNSNLILSHSNSNQNLQLTKHNQDYLKHIRFQTEDIYNHSSNEEKRLSILDSDEAHYGGSCNSADNSRQQQRGDDGFIASKSMPNIPKVSK